MKSSIISIQFGAALANPQNAPVTHTNLSGNKVGPLWSEYERIAHLHAKNSDDLAQAQAVPYPDGNRVLWASNWNAESGRPVGACVAELVGSK